MPQSRSLHWTRLRPRAFLFQRRRDRVDGRLELEPVELTRVREHAVFGIGVDPRLDHLVVRVGLRFHHRDDGEFVLQRELEVARVVRGHAHDGAFAVGHEHVVGDPHLDGLARERMQHREPGAHALFLLGRDVGFHRAAAAALVDEGLQRRIARAGREGHRMFGGDREERGSEQGVGTRREHLERAFRAHEGRRIGRVREGDLATLGLADPVGLHRLHALGPVGQLLEVA